ncbi:MAG: DUF445 domain-containing protein [Sporomusaceae bacterium]|nr:DUF445 domain-containing protein [Sporomusaceae bacterium]
MNRRKADKALAASFILFTAAVALRWFYRDAVWAEALFRTAEAALVGGVADWFAVTALFKRPLGIAFHTAIIPRNRNKIVSAMAYMVQEEFFSRQSLQQQLQKIRLVSLLVHWMENGGRRLVCRLLRQGMQEWLEAERPQLAASLAVMLENRLRQLPLHRYLSVWGRRLIRSGRADFLTAVLLAEVKRAAAGPSLRPALYRLLEQAAREAAGESALNRLVGAFLRSFDFINLDAAADSLYQRLLLELDALEQPSHPLRQWLNQRLQQSLDELESNSRWQQSLAEWQNGLIDRIPLVELLQPLLTELTAAGATAEPRLVSAAAAFVSRYWDDFRVNAALQDWFEPHLQNAVAAVVLSEHRLIGEVVGQTLRTLSDRELNQFIEDKVGEDLAWIRINGAVVGALAGLAVFLAGRYLYLPYLWPLLSSGR